MEDDLINEIVQFDRALMENILVNYDPNRRKNGLTRELNEGAILILNRVNGILKGYIEFLPKEENEIYVVSFQNLNNFISRNFILKICDFLKLRQKKMLTSSVHKNNLKSIRIHERLGFIARESDARILFEIRTESLLNKIQGLTLA